MTAPPRFLRLDARCPSCGRPPAVRVNPLVAKLVMRTLEPTEPVQNVRCHCGTIYTIHAAAYRGAAA